MLDSAAKAAFHLLAQSPTLKKVASRFGMRKPSSFARRFIAGESVAEAIAAARVLQSRGLSLTLDYLGESVANLAEAERATREYLAAIDAIIASGIERNISLKLTQLGLDVDKASAVDNLRKILGVAEPAGFFVRIDMENSPYTEVTLEIFETLWQQGYRQVGVVLQSALYRSEAGSRTGDRPRRARPTGQRGVQGTEVGRVSEESRRRRRLRRMMRRLLDGGSIRRLRRTIPR